jgi:hypothetical protein
MTESDCTKWNVQLNWVPLETFPSCTPQALNPSAPVNRTTGNASERPDSGSPIFEPQPFCAGLSQPCC